MSTPARPSTNSSPAAIHRRLVVEGVRYRNRIQSPLDLAWPEYLTAHFADLDHRTPVAVLERWPMPTDLLTADEAEVRGLVHPISRGHVGAARVDALLKAARTTVALTTAADMRRHELTALFQRWTTSRQHLAEVNARLATLVADCPSAQALTTVPELSAAGAAPFVAELGTPEDYEHPRQVLKLAGMNLARKESGTSVRGRVKQTKRGRPLLRRQLFLLAGRWRSGRGLYRDDYLALRLRNGGSKTSALCAIARRLVPMLLHVMRTGEAFDPERWQAGRAAPGAPAVPRAPQPARRRAA